MKDKSKAPFGWNKVILALSLLLLLVFGAWFYRIQEQTMRQKVAGDLGAIAHLKADQINAWRKDQLDDASIISQDTFIFQSVSRFIAPRSEAEGGTMGSSVFAVSWDMARSLGYICRAMWVKPRR